MPILSRSSTTKHKTISSKRSNGDGNRWMPGLSSTLPNIRRQRSDSCVNDTGPQATEKWSNSQLRFRNHDVPPSPLSPTLFLPVASAVGGASSIDTGSDDDDLDFDVGPCDHRNDGLHADNLSPLPSPGLSMFSNRTSDKTSDFFSGPISPLSPSFSDTFRDKLHIGRRSRRRTISSVFSMLIKKTPDERQRRQLYDDGSCPTFPIPPPRRSTPDDEERDQYGFVKSTQWVTLDDYDEFDRRYKPIAQRRVAKWRQLIEEHNGKWPQRSSKFKRYIRKGIPSELRGQAWFHYSGAETRMEAHPGVYQRYVEEAESLGYKNEHLDIIERDLHRTFPDNVKFQTSVDPQGAPVTDIPALKALRRVLSAFSLYAPSIGYCQSLNYIAGLLLLFMDEEKAFWTFVAVTHDILPKNVYDMTMEGANIDQTILMMLLSERCPQIWNRVGAGKSFYDCEETNSMPTCALVTSHWFLTLFINVLPIESVLRVWDCLFYEGQKVLFRVALAIFKSNEHEIMSVNDPLEIFQIVQNMPKRMIDCHTLMEATFGKYGSLTRIGEIDVEHRRGVFKARRDQRLKVDTPNHHKVKRTNVGGTFVLKAKEAKRRMERATSSRRLS